MTAIYILCGVSLFLSAANLLATLFLSNSLFRILVREPIFPPAEPEAPSKKGLVEVENTPTYDPRFRR